MEDRQIIRILQGLGSRQPQQGWAEFLECYSPVILQVIALVERDADHISGCFLFVCEQLSRDGFRRVRRFRVEGPAQFSTWLRVVVRNLCLDWHRREFGRQRLFHSVAQLSALDQEVFRALYQRGSSTEDAFLELRARYPGLTREKVAESQERVEQALTSRQRWLMSVGRGRVEELGDGREEDGGLSHQMADPRQDPESFAAAEERRAALARAVGGLPAQDRLLLRLRYEQELTLEQVARLAGLGDAQRVHRKISEVLERLRKELG